MVETMKWLFLYNMTIITILPLLKGWVCVDESHPKGK